MSSAAVKVEGLRELDRAFIRADIQLHKQLRTELREAAEPVRADAERLAASQIRNISAGDPWSEMRTGVTTRLVYVAPKKRGSKRGSLKRRNLAGLLMERAMQPALDQNEHRIVSNLDDMLGRISTDWGQGG